MAETAGTCIYLVRATLGRLVRPAAAAAVLLMCAMLGLSSWGPSWGPPTVGPQSAWAHIPVLEPESSSDAAPDPVAPADPFPGAHEIPDPSISRAVYGVLAKGEEFDVYRFRVPQRITIPVSILVPTRDDLEDFRPSFALIGPGLGDAGAGSPTPMAPQSVLERVAALELATDSDPDVVIVSAPPEQWGSFFEPFSFERYYQGPEVQISVEPGTDYYVAVFHPARQEGDYVLGLGTRESFGPGDVFSSIVAVGRIKLGLYGQGEIRWGALAIGLGTITLIVALAVGLLVRSRRRRRSRDGGPTARSETPPDTVLNGR